MNEIIASNGDSIVVARVCGTGLLFKRRVVHEGVFKTTTIFKSIYARSPADLEISQGDIWLTEDDVKSEYPAALTYLLSRSKTGGGRDDA